MPNVTIKAIESKEHYYVRCPLCSKCFCQGSWHVTISDEDSDYFVGEIRKCTNPQCGIKVRCPAVFNTREAALARYETVYIGVQVLQSTKHLELFETSFDVITPEVIN